MYRLSDKVDIPANYRSVVVVGVVKLLAMILLSLILWTIIIFGVWGFLVWVGALS
jgi:hypothetical protein